MKKIIITSCLCVIIVAGIVVGINFIKSDKVLESDPSVESDNIVEKLSESVVLLEVYDNDNEMVAIGSGYFIYDDKTIVTNYHVIEDAYTVTAITDSDRKIRIKTMIDYDEEKDIAILRCDVATGIPYIPFAEMSELKRGQEVIAIGSPLGIQNTVSTGVISSFDNKSDVMKIYTTAPISNGSSGGLLATVDGKAIGITSASYVDGQNLNIAIDIREIKKLYEDDFRKSTLLSDFFESKEHFYKYKEVTVGEVLNNYKYYQGQKACVVGWVSTSLYEEEIAWNVLFVVDSRQQVRNPGILPMTPYADQIDEYDRASRLEAIILGTNITIVDGGRQVKIYGEIDYSIQFKRVGITPYKIEVLD